MKNGGEYIDHYRIFSQQTEPRAKRVSLPTIPWSRIARSQRTRWSRLAVLLVLLLLSGYLLYPVLPASAATMTIVPMSRSLEQTFQLHTAARTNIAQHQVRGRELIDTTSRQSISESVENQGVLDATQAHGQLVFSQINQEINLSLNPLRFDLSNGLLQVVTVDKTDMQPGSTYTINAQVVEAGSKGNIPADSIDGFYNTGLVHRIGAPPDFLVSNPQPFTGGNDVYSGPVVSHSDVDRAAAQLEYEAQQAFQSQLQPGEALLNNLTCVPVDQQVQPAIGQAGTTVTVTEAMNCTITTYDSKSAYQVALHEMQQLAVQRFGPSFVLVGQLHIIAMISDPSDATSPNFQVDAQGLWQLLLDTSSRQLIAQTIAGKSQAEARSLLLTRFAARTTSFSLTWWWGQHLPEDPKAIQIVDH